MSDSPMERKNRVFIGGISDRIQKDDIEREFGRFGKLTNVWVAQNPPGFAFVEYDHISEADLAVAEMNGKSFLGSLNKIRVEHSHGGGSRNRMRRGPPGGDRGPPGGGRSNYRDRYNNGSGGHEGGGYRNGNSYEGGGYQRRDGYNSGRYSSGGDGGDRRRNFDSSSNGRYNNGGGRYRSNSGSDRGYGGGGGGGGGRDYGGYGGGMRNRSRSPPMGRSGKYGGGNRAEQMSPGYGEQFMQHQNY